MNTADDIVWYGGVSHRPPPRHDPVSRYITYCWRCAERHNWPMGDDRRVAICDVCGKREDCVNVPAKPAWAPVAPGVEALVAVPVTRRRPAELPSGPYTPFEEQLMAPLVVLFIIGLLGVMMAVVAVMAAGQPSSEPTIERQCTAPFISGPVIVPGHCQEAE